MIMNSEIQSLKDSGLNIFLSAEVSDLPDEIFPFSDIQKTKTLCLIGHGGNDLWKKLPHPLKVSDHPIDHFSKIKMQEFDSDCEILFPNDRFTMPLQKIARALHLSTQSPIGIDISHEFGLWFALRGVFLTDKKIRHSPLEKRISPCDTCLEKPCLKASNFLEARLICPIKKEHQYSDSQIEYHQSALDIL